MAQYNGKTKAHLKDHDTNDFGHLHITDRTTDPKQTPFEFGEKCHGIVVKEAFKSSSKNKLTAEILHITATTDPAKPLVNNNFVGDSSQFIEFGNSAQRPKNAGCRIPTEECWIPNLRANN